MGMPLLRLLSGLGGLAGPTARCSGVRARATVGWQGAPPHRAAWDCDLRWPMPLIVEACCGTCIPLPPLGPRCAGGRGGGILPFGGISGPRTFLLRMENFPLLSGPMQSAAHGQKGRPPAQQLLQTTWHGATRRLACSSHPRRRYMPIHSMERPPAATAAARRAWAGRAASCWAHHRAGTRRPRHTLTLEGTPGKAPLWW